MNEWRDTIANDSDTIFKTQGGFNIKKYSRLNIYGMTV